MAENTKINEKLKVVGWTDYDNEYFDSCELTDEVVNAVVEEVREKGYLFGGNSHQDYSSCCPVLSNGCCARFSCRGWGGVIAMAYDKRGKDGHYDYMCGYMDEMIVKSAVCRPDAGVNFAEIIDSGKTYRIEVARSQYDHDWMKRFEARLDNEEVAEIKRGDYLEMIVQDEYDIPYFIDTFKVREIYRGKTFEEVIEQADNDYGYFDSEYFGYPECLTKEQLIEQLYKDYPLEQVEKSGVVLFRAVPFR